MIPQAAVWTWFGIAWLFLAAVFFKHWYHREHVERDATEAALKRCKADTTHQYEQDAL